MSRSRPQSNGNMVSDGNRGATLTYNSRNVGPLEFAKTVTIGSKKKLYDYDASGVKPKYYDETYNAATSDTVNIKYVGGFEYNLVISLKEFLLRKGN